MKAISPCESELADYVPAMRANDDETRLRLLLHDFGMVWHSAHPHRRRSLVAAEPESIDDRWDAFCAAYAEHLCTEHKLAVPAWTQKPDRYLGSFWFAGGCFAFDRARTVMTTPQLFRAHGIWFPRDELTVV